MQRMAQGIAGRRSGGSWGALARATIDDWFDDKAPRLGAALAFYSVFSLAPLVVIALFIAGLVLPGEGPQQEVLAQIRSLAGERAAAGVAELIAAAREPPGGATAPLLGVAAMLLGASGVFGQLQDALNTIWEVKPRPGRGLRGLIRDRFFSFTLVLGTGFLLLVSLIISAVLSAAAKWLAGLLPFPAWLMLVVNGVVSFLLVALLFALIFKFVPDAMIAWTDAAIGGLFTAALFSIGKLLIGLYLGRSTVISAYGAAGSIVLILLWIYYAAQILFLGAEFTQAYARIFGSPVRPAPNAVSVTDEDRKQEGLATSTAV